MTPSPDRAELESELIYALMETVMRMPEDTLKRWVDNPDALKKVLAAGPFSPSPVPTHIIDCDAAPFVPAGWRVAHESRQVPGRVRGQLEWNPANVRLYLAKNQQNDNCTKGSELRKELSNLPVLPANVLDYLLTHPDLIPEEWKWGERARSTRIFFWGTIYHGFGSNLLVRCLDWNSSRWDYRRFNAGWDDCDPAAILGQ
jgi:hypothetical protein